MYDVDSMYILLQSYMYVRTCKVWAKIDPLLALLSSWSFSYYNFVQ
jgi:hypothetical protein